MHDVSDHLGTEERDAKFRATAGVPASWSLTATARPQSAANFEAVLLAIAGHDLRQPLQIIQQRTNALDVASERAPNSYICGPARMRSID